MRHSQEGHLYAPGTRKVLLLLLLVLRRTQDSSAVYKSIYDESSPVRCSAAGSVRLAHSWTSFNLSASKSIRVSFGDKNLNFWPRNGK